MKNRKLYVQGKELHIKERIGRGGEGEVYSLRNLPGFAVKIYFSKLVSKREKKIHAMVSRKLGDATSMVAFPRQVVLDERGNFAGFTMPLVERHQEIHELQTPSSRQKYFPRADYRFIVRVALNIARTFAQIHATGCVVGDVNQRGILVSPDARVVVIDADSFQIIDGAQQYLCVVGVPEYTPPELQGQSLKDILRTPDHDAFGLAVCIFQLLCMDRHPFSGYFNGNSDISLEQSIAEYRFAYSARNTGMTPPHGTVCLNDLTPRVGTLFEAAFSPNQVGKRPSPLDWISALEEFETVQRVCNRNKLHYYARNAVECPWCRMENEYGRPLFLDVDFTNVGFTSGRIRPDIGLVLDIPTLMAMVNGISLPHSISVPFPQISTIAEPSQAAQQALSQKQIKPFSKIGGVAALIAAICIFKTAVPILVTLCIAFFGVWLLMRPFPSLDGLLTNHRRISQAIAARIQQLQVAAPIEQVIRKKAEILDAIDEFKQVSSAFGNVTNDYDKVRKQKQLDDHLSQYTIRAARISKVNSTDLVSLSSYGFSTAFDAKRRNVQRVPGIGPVKTDNIKAWIRRVESEFQFQTEYNHIDRLHIQKLKNEIITKQQGLEEHIQKLLSEFRIEAQRFERWKALRDPELLNLCKELVQLETDLRRVGLTIPSRHSVPAASVPTVSSFQKNRKVPTVKNVSNNSSASSPIVSPPTVAQNLNCPQCNSPMIRRVAGKGSRKGKAFLGCSRYPRCKGTRAL